MIYQFYIDTKRAKTDGSLDIIKLLQNHGYAVYEAPDCDKLPHTLEEIEAILESK